MDNECVQIFKLNLRIFLWAERKHDFLKSTKLYDAYINYALDS